jgi:aspartyl-tRNA(Asn)/glutamyl-tRNA(Gln) amidotransferase subunit A
MTGTTLDTAYVLDQVVGHESTDIFSLPDKQENWFDEVRKSSLPDKIIWSPTLGYAEVDEEIKTLCEKAVQQLSDAGVTVIENDAVWSKDPVLDWLVFWTCARARAQQHLMGTPDWEKIDPGLRTMIQIGAEKMTGSAYALAIDACHHFNIELEQAFSEAPLILSPATCGHTPLTDRDGTVNGSETPGWIGFTVGLNMTRNPAGTVPIATTEAGMPIALQIIGRQRADLSVLKAMHCMEEVFEFSQGAAVAHDG